MQNGVSLLLVGCEEKFLLRKSGKVLEETAQEVFKKCGDVALRDMV